MLNNIEMESDISCTGCGICGIACPSSAIKVKETEGGFRQAIINHDACLSCGKCFSVCPRYVNPGESGDPYRTASVYAAWNDNPDIRFSSSSGGVADAVSRAYLPMGYKIVGAAYDYNENLVKHIIVDSPDKLEEIRGSKYLPSRTSEAFSQISPDGKYVVFGTPCQIYGLRKSFERKNRNNDIVFVDFFCHGVPSILLWEKYLEHVKKHSQINKIDKISFRDKSTGWHSYSMKIEGNGKVYKKNMNDDLFYNFYLSNLCHNQACFSCPFRHSAAASDIRLGDFWGSKFQQDKNGVSLVVLLTDTGEEVWNNISKALKHEEVSIENLKKSQPVEKIPVPARHDSAMALLKSDKSLNEIFNIHLRKAYIRRKIILAVKKLFPQSLKTSLKRLLRR